MRGVGKKSKMHRRYLIITSDDLWRIRDKLDGKKSSLGKTYKSNREANDKFGNFGIAVYELEAHLRREGGSKSRSIVTSKSAENDLRQPCTLRQGCGKLRSGRRGSQ